MSSRTNRRQFLQTTAATGVGFLVAGGLVAQESKTPSGRVPAGSHGVRSKSRRRRGTVSPNEQIAIACIGVGGKGSSDTEDAGKHGQVVALCDVDDNKLGAMAVKFPKAKHYKDFRKMLEEIGDSIDAVTVSTPDHNHAAASLMAMRMGKHCFCQKPLTHSVYEARLMAREANERKLATQMGNQWTADPNLRHAAALVKSGVLGTVREVHVWTDRPWWPQGNPRPNPDPVPSYLDWNVWLGPAPDRPYAKDTYHTFRWRGWWDFGTGALGDMACHTVNMPYMALNLRDPVSVQAETSGHNHDSYPKWSKIVFEYPALGDRPAVKLFWYDGGKRPDDSLMTEAMELYEEEVAKGRGKTKGKKRKQSLLVSGCIVKGDKDTIFAPGDYAEHPQKLSSKKPLPDVEFTKSPGHFEEWIRAIRGGEPATSNFQGYAGGLTETILLGNLAVWVADKPGMGEKVLWDPQNMRSPNVAGLEPILKPTYRPGYTLDI
jgi:predicted dehydrogenase